MSGNDWPVANLRSGYNKVEREVNRALARLSADERDQVLGGTAIAVYASAQYEGWFCALMNC